MASQHHIQRPLSVPHCDGRRLRFTSHQEKSLSAISQFWVSFQILNVKPPFAQGEDLFSILHFVICYFRYVENWLPVQVLFSQSAFDIFDHTLYDVTVQLYKVFQKVVSCQVVSAAWCCKVANLALPSCVLWCGRAGQ